MNSEDLAELQRIFPNTTPGKWKLWANTIMADTRGDSDVKYATEVATFKSRRTWDADMCCILQRNMPDLLADAQALDDMRTLDRFQAAGNHVSAPEQIPDGQWIIYTQNATKRERHLGSTQEVARAKAAAWAREQKP